MPNKIIFSIIKFENKCVAHLNFYKKLFLIIPYNKIKIFIMQLIKLFYFIMYLIKCCIF